MRRRRVEIIIIFLHIFAMIAFASRQPENSLFKNRVFAIPERERETDFLMAVGNSPNSVFIPAIGTAACVFVRKIIPSRAIGRIILTDSSPSAFAEVWSPAFPMLFPFSGFL